MARFVFAHPIRTPPMCAARETLALIRPISRGPPDRRPGAHGGLLALERSPNDKGKLRT